MLRKNTRYCLSLTIVLCIFLSACGYKLAADTPSVLGDGTRTLKIKEVDNPTLEPWLTHAIRSSLRNEINARYLAKWVDSGPADYEISVKVESYTSRSWMTDRIDEAILYDTNLSISAILYDGSTNKEVWRSGRISYSERLETPGEKSGANEILTQVMQRLADKLRNTF